MNRLDWLTRFALATDKHHWWLRFSLIGVLSLISGAVIVLIIPRVSPIYAVYETYYIKALPRVQTVDFNMLFYMLPSALSNAMQGHSTYQLKENPELSRRVQAILDSNYGVFDLIITHQDVKENPSEDDILYRPQNRGLKDTLPRGDIVHSDLILYPHPPCSTANYPEPKSGFLEYDEKCKAMIQEAINSKRSIVLGRVHYVRGRVPSFWDKLKEFNEEPFKDDSGYQFMLYGSVATIMVFLVVGFVLYTMLYFFFRYVVRHHADKSALEHKLSDLERELNKFRQFDSVFRGQVDNEFTSRIGNEIQRIESEYNSILKRLEIDVRNITHDIRKAPLLCCKDTIIATVDNLDFQKALATPEDFYRVKESIKSIFEKINSSINSSIAVINDIIKNLDEMISLKGKECNFADLIDQFSTNLPKNLRSKNYRIKFNREGCNYSIKINPWHFRSILKNIIENSARVLQDKKMDKLDFQGEITVSCGYEAANRRVYVTIEDNGDGIPENLLDKLYQTHERLNRTMGQRRGNGSMIVYAYLALFDGKVRVENRSEGGGRITVSFPIV